MGKVSNKKGGALIVALAGINAIIIIAAALFFLGRYQVAKTQADGYARNIVLTALKNYQASKADCEASHNSIYDIKQCRLEKVFDAIKLETDGLAKFDQLIADPDAVNNTTYSLAIKNFNQLVVGDNAAPGALLTPGVWTNVAAACGGAANTPCFRDFAADNDGTINTTKFNHYLTSLEEPNAFRVKGRLFPKGVLTFFGKSFLGIDSLPISVNATSQIVPRRGCFLVDISTSTTSLSHTKKFIDPRDDNRTCPRGQNAGVCCDVQLGIKAGVCCPSTVQSYNEFYSSFGYSLNFNPQDLDNDINNLSNNLDRDYIASQRDKNWACMAEQHPNGTYTNNKPLLHFKNNYIKKYSIRDADYDNVAAFSDVHPPKDDYPADDFTLDSYWVDKEADPEPLKTIFDGLKSALQEFSDKAAPGDKACLIFYDKNFIWPRMIKLTDHWNDIIKYTDFDKSRIDATVSEVSAPGSTTKYNSLGFTKLIRHMLFPASVGEYISENGKSLFIPKNYTNTINALKVALDMFARDSQQNGLLSSDFLVLISDGLANCYDTNNTGNVTCSNNFDAYERSMAALKLYAHTTLKDSRIPLNVILVGDYVNPNTRCVINPATNKCYTDTEYRAVYNNTNVYNFTDGNRYKIGNTWYNGFDALTLDQKRLIFSNASSDTPFTKVNSDYYEMAVATQGLFVPIRKKPSTCTEGEAQIFADNAHIETDPFCRKPSDQVQSALRDIVRFSPYSVVDIK